jgi:hypothetical protein
MLILVLCSPEIFLDRPLEDFQLKRPAFIQGDSYEKWKKETCLDIRTGSRTEVDGAQESAGGKNSQEAKTV